MVKPRTCSSYSTVSAHGVFGRWSSYQSSSSCTTTALGTYGAESRSSRTVSATSRSGQLRTAVLTASCAV